MRAGTISLELDVFGCRYKKKYSVLYPTLERCGSSKDGMKFNNQSVNDMEYMFGSDALSSTVGDIISKELEDLQA